MAKKTPTYNSIDRKISKTTQTRGADNDEIFQNRVKRCGTVLIPYSEFEACKLAPSADGKFENGFIVLINPKDYFALEGTSILELQGLKLGENTLVFYETREQWNTYPIRPEWKPATSRKAPLGGEYVARVPATTAVDGDRIIKGYNISKLRGAGIRVYEYADSKTVGLCKLQLEYLFWRCHDIGTFLSVCGEEEREILKKKRDKAIKEAHKNGVDDLKRLKEERILDDEGYTICPLCLERISALGFASKMVQMAGREVPDLTITNTSLFHIHELRPGQFNHRLYNLGWGHHHCNVTVADKGVEGTLDWMKRILEKNGRL